MRSKPWLLLGGVVLPALAFFPCGDDGASSSGSGSGGAGGAGSVGASRAGDPINQKPAFIPGAILSATYDGDTDDLLTAGLGKSGLQLSSAPAAVDPSRPTTAELRRLAIYTNYRVLLDMSPAGGFGVLYGPNIDVSEESTLGEGKIPGTEYLAYADDGSGHSDVTMMVQVPGSFPRSRWRMCRPSAWRCRKRVRSPSARARSPSPAEPRFHSRAALSPRADRSTLVRIEEGCRAGGRWGRAAVRAEAPWAAHGGARCFNVEAHD